MKFFTSLSDQARQELIAERKRNSVLWRAIHLLGSLRIAVGLLLSLAAACAAATWIESRFDSSVAQYYVYRSPWFLGWLVLLCLNLFAVTLTRIPWKPRHLGFVITHYGIILLLSGAMIGRIAGFEGFVHLRLGEPAEDRVTLNQTALFLEDPFRKEIFRVSFPAELWRPRSDHPRKLTIPGTDLRLVVDDFSSDLALAEEVVPSSDPSSGPGITLLLQSRMARQKTLLALLEREPAHQTQDFFGLAKVHWLSGPPASSSGRTVHEAQVVFARSPDQPITHAAEGIPSHYRFFLVPDEQSRQMLLVAISPSGQKNAWEVASHIGKALELPGGAQALLTSYWPDFAMREGKPTSLSDRPENPAVLVQLRWTEGGGGSTGLSLWKSPDDDRIAFRALNRREEVSAEGKATLGQNFSLGWADWEASVLRYESHASIQSIIRKREPGTAFTMTIGSGVRAWVEDPKSKAESPRLWILSGLTQTFAVEGIPIRVAYGLESRSLPFRISLEKFAVPREEGSESPVDFQATVRFEDPKAGTTRVATAHMNSPATFPGGFWRSALGRNYKFSQASWNPQDLQETTLQVLYDPGWPCKWVGSLLICGGILLMFLHRGSPKNPTPVPTVLPPDEIPSERSAGATPTR
ncbi:cytochrome C biogenesis protein ResB [Methylacidimicrobium sp. B4]|uniref:cytochrome C biogenesis protein ResB n=1 Tax=Methylacidimicrobium sp. B4 TaxID=2796139 RepID=UPI001A8CF214|nr:cytochrome C biogenesis protein ResB [Methylacidimicrobium sp. B4]QSR84271.1 cytochrome C biogenesis protein ResB [Methylacidimicrobium sp. B4]